MAEQITFLDAARKANAGDLMRRPDWGDDYLDFDFNPATGNIECNRLDPHKWAFWELTAADRAATDWESVEKP